MVLSNKNPHLVLLSSPAHPTPTIELGKRLVTCQSVKVTVFVSCFVKAAAAVSKTIGSIPKTELFDVIQLPPADISGLVEPGHTGLTAVVSGVRVTKPAFLSAISALETPPTALIVHVYAIECLKIADELKIPKYVYTSSHAWYLALILYTPVLDEEVGGEYADKKEPFLLPGCTPVRPEDLPDPMIVQTKKDYLEFLQIGLDFPKVDGILVNTWEELQPKTLAALRDYQLLGSIVKAPIFPIGPIATEGTAGLKSELFYWLDKQPSGSVLYISFGSMGGLSVEQMTELSWGLELTQQRFIWVVRPPMAKTGSGSAPKFGHNADDMSSYVPEGFISRTRDRGVVVPHWAPQVQILSHPSCGGFFTHCGWNSAIECIINGLPMIAWPLYAEQRMNATLLTEELGIAVRSQTIPSKGVVGREEVATMVRKIFVDEEGRKIRGRVKELKLGADKAWSHGGSSYEALHEMVKHCQKSRQLTR
ncbi:PREDICTED: anthocyanidin 3-O-glucosyltransferase 5 [Theobroma cacao]|uniref:Anthocyanidin 3-O-glucosyltransferase 5 n=1 Tax=Theobroma cacao TaxID=3641 RepID=A0AB32VR54_THECC|nr:PREDICTED: anthocyanidin 3-O-glucosyltransferase 5 [Theobroma cacao]